MKVPLIDAHVHLDTYRGVEELRELATTAGIDRYNIVCVAGTPERSLAVNSIALLAKARHPLTTTVFGGLQYGIGQPVTSVALRRQAERLWAAGCDGMKMLEGKPTSRKRIPFAMDDPVYDQYYGFLQEAGIPILWHVADPATFWDPHLVSATAKQQGWDYSDGSFPSREQLYGEVDRVLAKFPRLRVTFAHFYFLSNEPDRAESFLNRWPSVTFDITPGSEMYRNFSKAPDRWRAFFIKYQDRILFGTDNIAPVGARAVARGGMLDKIRMMRQFLETTGTFEGFCTATSRNVIGLGLPPETLTRIYHLNFERVAGATPRPLDLKVARQCGEPALQFARDQAGQAHQLEELEAADTALAALQSPA
jgi:predicted TIM-barrel fold metal-dependent hydrolase